MVRDDMESGIVMLYKNKGIIISELISLPFFLRSSNILFKKLFSRQIFLKSIYFSSCKFLITRNLHLLWLQTKLCLILTKPWLPVYKRFLLQHIRSTMYNHYASSHICCLWLEKDPIWFLEQRKLVAWTLHRVYDTMMIPSLMLPMT